jgi:hypothetical protein
MNNFTDKTPEPTNSEETTFDTMQWIMPIILLGLLSVGIFVWMKGYNSEVKAKKENTELNEAGNSISNAADSAAKSIITDNTNLPADTSR